MLQVLNNSIGLSIGSRDTAIRFARRGLFYSYFWPLTEDFDEYSGMPGTVTRDSAASYIDTDGVLQIADGDDTPFSHDSIHDEEYVVYEDELVTNGDMELDSNWTDVGTPTTNEQSSVQAHTGTYSRYIVADASVEGCRSEAFNIVKGVNYEIIINVYIVSGTFTASFVNSTLTTSGSYTTTGQWIKVNYRSVGASTAGERILLRSSGGAAEFYVDNVSVKQVHTYTNTRGSFHDDNAWFDGAVLGDEELTDTSDMTGVDWIEDSNNPVVDATHFLATAQFDFVYQRINTVESTEYIFSFVASIAVGNQTTGYSMFHQDSETVGDGSAGKSTLICLLYTSPSPRDRTRSRMPSSA